MSRVVLVLGWLATATLSLLACTAGPAAADTTVHARLVPVNHSGVHGTATLTAHGDGSLTVVIHSRGLVPGQRHAQHIHGMVGGGHFMCPTAADDTNHDGLLTNEEASGEYGAIYLSLTTSGDASARSGLVTGRMPVADSQGRIDYRRTFTAAEVPDALLARLSSLHIVQHGIDVNHDGKYTVGAAGVSTFAKNLGFDGVPEEATDPASCGMVTGAGASVHPMGGMETGGAPGGHRGLGLAGGLLVAGSAVALAVVGRGARRRGVRG